MKKQYKSSVTENHKIKKKYFFDSVPLKDYVAMLFLEIKIHCWKIK